MKTIVVNIISFVLASLFFCHGLTDGMILKGRKIEENSNFVILSVEPKLMPISFFNPFITLLDAQNKFIDHKFKINKSTFAPLILYETSTEIPDPNDDKRIIGQANNAEGHDVHDNKMNSIIENSNEIKKMPYFNKSTLNEYIFKKRLDFLIPTTTEIIDYDTKLSVTMTVKNHSTGMNDTTSDGAPNSVSSILTTKNQSMKKIDNILNGVSKWATNLKRNMDLRTITACALISCFIGLLLFFAVRANKLRKARPEENLQLPENISMYIV